MLYRKNLSIEIRKGTLFVSISRYSDLHVNFTSKVPVFYLQKEAIFPDNAYAKQTLVIKIYLKFLTSSLSTSSFNVMQ